MEKLTVFQKLLKVQTRLKVPKNQYNKFGQYNFRSCEDILAAVKPIAEEYNVLVVCTDELVMIGDRYYIKATARFIDCENVEISEIDNYGYAREEETKKGMDGSQVTGASSSYARKYALNGLLGIDDTEDSDVTNNDHKETENPQAPVVKTLAEKRELVIKTLKQQGTFEKTLEWAGSKGWGSIDEIPEATIDALLKKAEA